MALKLANSKVFPDQALLLRLAEGKGYKVRRAKEIIEQLSDGIMDYLKQSNEVQLFTGLRESIERAVARVHVTATAKKPYRYDRRKKYE